MAEPQGTVRVRRQGQAVIFHVAGRATAVLGLPLRRSAEQALAAGAGALRFDLRRCTHMDSTFLGTLLCLKRRLEQGGGELVLISPSPQCCRVLQQMGVEGLFPVRQEEEPATDDWTELCGDMQDVEGFRCNVAHAHEELASLEGPAGAQFREVVRSLAQELGDSRGHDG